MKRKVFSSLLLLVTMVAAGSMLFVSCKDYDDDINDLQNQITANATDLTSLVSEKVNNASVEIADLQAQAAALQAAYEAADEALQATMEASIANSLSSAEGYTDAQTAAANAYADVQAAAAQAAAIAAAQSAVDAAATSLQASLDAATATLEAQGISIESINSTLSEDGQSISDLQAKIEALVAADATLTEGITAAQARADEAYSLAQSAQTLAESNSASLTALQTSLESLQASAASTEALNSAIESVNTAIAANASAISTLNEETIPGLNTSIEGLQSQITALTDGDVADALAQANENAADIVALNTLLTTLSAANATAFETLNEAVAAAATSDQLTAVKEELTKLIEANQSDIATAQGDIAQLQIDVAANLATAEAYAKAQADAVAKDLNEQLVTVNGKISDLNTSIEALETAYKNADADLENEITNLTNALNSLKAELEGDYATSKNLTDALKDYVGKESLGTYLATLIADISSTYATQEALGTATTDIETLQGQVTTIINIIETQLGEGSFSDLDEGINTLDERLTDAEEAITTMQEETLPKINENLGLEMQRLKSLVFVPEVYVNGIECIHFATLEYQDWGSSSNWTADAAPTKADNYYISDSELEVQYLVNPSNVAKASIANLTFMANTAEDIATKAITSAPIEVAKYDISNGVMTLNLKKTDVTSNFGKSTSDFTIVALKAVIADEYLTDEESENGEEIAVYSDWARLYESTVTPGIHSTITGMGVDNSGKMTESNSSDKSSSHYWAYSAVYPNKKGTSSNTALASEYADYHIAKEVYYEDEIDLRTLVMVCGHDGEQYDLDNYNLAFEFHLMDYYLDNEGSTTDATNQKLFAKLADDGYTLYSTARDNETTKNRDAISKEPVIQVVLKDKANGTVVDVRYFKIKWIDKISTVDYGSLGSFTEKYECGVADKDTYTEILGEEVLNALYTYCGMSRTEFHTYYTLDTNLYASLADATNRTNVVSGLGTIVDLADGSGSGTTHNLKWSINTTNTEFKATQSDYAAGSKTVTAYGCFYSNSNNNDRIIFSVTVTLTISKMELAGSHNLTMWTNNSTVLAKAATLDTDEQNYGTSKSYETTMLLANLLEAYSSNPSSVSDLGKFDPANSALAYDDIHFEFNSNSSKLPFTANGYTYNCVDNDYTVLKYSTDGGKTWAGNAAILSKSVGNTSSNLEDNILIQLVEEAEYGTSESTPTAGAKNLLGQEIPVKLHGEYCGMEDDLDVFSVMFYEPLTLTVTDASATISASAPSTTKTITLGDGKITLTENKNVVSDARTVYSTKKNTSKTTEEKNWEQELMPWYGIDTTNPIEFDTDNMTVSGSSFNSGDYVLYNLNAELADDGTITISFTNNSSNSILNGFDVVIPFTIKSKWQDLTGSLVVTIVGIND